VATFTLFDEFSFRLGNKEIDLNSDTFKAVLTNTAPDQAAHTVLTDITQIANGNGYLTGGATLANLSWAETEAGSGIWRWSFDDPSWTASGGDIATHRYLVVYDDTHANDVLVGYVDRGASAVITSGNTRTWDFGSSGAFEQSHTP